MARGEVVLVKCSLTRGGFPSELVFHIPAPGGGELAGVAPRDYCLDQSKKPLTSQLRREEQVEGCVVGLLLGEGESPGTSRVNLPDNDVYEVPDGLLVRNGEFAHVSLLVIGNQKGPTSASKMGPPGFKCILRGASPLAAAALVCSCSLIVVLLRVSRRAKRKRALRGRNPPGIARPTVCHLVHPKMAPAHAGGPGACFLPPAHQSPCLRKSRGFGGRAPKASPLGRLAAWLAGLLLPLHRLPEAVAFAIHLEDGASVRQAIQ